MLRDNGASTTLRNDRSGAALRLLARVPICSDISQRYVPVGW